MNTTGLSQEACDALSTLVVDIDTASQSSESTSAPAAVQLNHNAAYMEKLEAEIATVLEKVPELTKASQPLTTEQGSDMSPFSFAEFEKLMKERKSYRCAGNISWVATTTPTPAIRRRWWAIHGFRSFVWYPIAI